MGSKVILGNLLVIPLEDSLLYVEPAYIGAQNASCLNSSVCWRPMATTP